MQGETRPCDPMVRCCPSGALAAIGAAGIALKAICELDGEIGAFPDLAGRIGTLLACPAHFVERFEQTIEIPRQEFPAEGGIAASPFEVVLGEQCAHLSGNP